MGTDLTQRVKFKVFSLGNFAVPDLINGVLNAFDELPPFLRPKRYGPFEPADRDYDYAKRSDLISVWLNEECAGETNQPQSGELVLESGSHAKAAYLISWSKGPSRRFNGVGGSATLGGYGTHKSLGHWVELSTETTVATNAVFGQIERQSPQTDNRLSQIDLNIRLPEPSWVMFFGPPYVELFGRDRLRSAPCSEVVELPSGHFRLMLTLSPFEPVPDEVKERIREHFGLLAFTEPGKPIRGQKVGLVPVFDFRHVMLAGSI